METQLFMDLLTMRSVGKLIPLVKFEDRTIPTIKSKGLVGFVKQVASINKLKVVNHGG